MVEERRADKDSPDDPRQAHTCPEFPQPVEQARQRQRHKNMIALESAMHRVPGQVGDVTPIMTGLIQGWNVGHPPQQVSPPDAVARAVRIALGITVLMMNAM